MNTAPVHPVVGRRGDYETVPGELRQRRQWVLWRYEEREGKLTKVPYRAGDPDRRASSTDPATWSPFEQAVGAASRADGIGFVFSIEDPYVGVDLDQDFPEPEWVIGRLNSYTEHSVSGTGLHVIAKGSLAHITHKNRRGDFEVYETGRFFVVTGAHVEGTPTTIEARQSELQEVVSRYLPTESAPELVRTKSGVSVSDGELVDKMLRANNGAKARRLWNGAWQGEYRSQSEADLALCNLLAFWTGRDPERIDALFRQSGLMREKWQREDYRTDTIAAAISTAREVYQPERTQGHMAKPNKSDARVPDGVTAQDTVALSATTPSSNTLEASPFVDWSTFWDLDQSGPDWTFPDVLARGRGHAIYTSSKGMKSLLLLYMAAELATGSQPIVCIYLDYEMSTEDLMERLDDMGYGPGSDLSRLKYALLPTLPPLDTRAGGGALMTMVDGVQAEWPGHHLVVIIDTISRAVAGEENSADTVRAFYAHTGIELKRRGVTWCRLDHGGKDPTRGQRGSSGKGDDVDVVWRLGRTQNGVCLIRDVARMHWIPERVTFRRTEDPLAFRRLADDWPDATRATAEELDHLAVPLDASARTAQAALRGAGKGVRKQVILAALRWRRERDRGQS